MPGSQTELAIVTADFIKVYDLGSDVLSPQFYFLVPSGKVRDSTLAIFDDSKYVIIMSTAGHIYFQCLNQVWSPTQLFSLSFLLKPLVWEHYSLPFLPATPSWTLEGLFELTRCPSGALDSPRALLLKLQGYKDTVRCTTLGKEVPGHRQEQLTQTLIVKSQQKKLSY